MTQLKTRLELRDAIGFLKYLTRTVTKKGTVRYQGKVYQLQTDKGQGYIRIDKTRKFDHFMSSRGGITTVQR